MLLTHRQLPEQLPVLNLGAENLHPQPQIKWLRVIIDRKLTFSEHCRALEKRGSQVSLQLARLVRTGWGIPLSQCLQLTSSLIHPRTDYAVSVWHQQGRNTVTVKEIQRINSVAQHFTLGVFKTHPLVFLKHNTVSPSALHRLDARAQKAVAQRLTLPDTNPAAVEAPPTTKKLNKNLRQNSLSTSTLFPQNLIPNLLLPSPTSPTLPHPTPFTPPHLLTSSSPLAPQMLLPARAGPKQPAIVPLVLNPAAPRRSALTPTARPTPDNEDLTVLPNVPLSFSPPLTPQTQRVKDMVGEENAGNLPLLLSKLKNGDA